MNHFNGVRLAIRIHHSPPRGGLGADLGGSDFYKVKAFSYLSFGDVP